MQEVMKDDVGAVLSPRFQVVSSLQGGRSREEDPLLQGLSFQEFRDTKPCSSSDTGKCPTLLMAGKWRKTNEIERERYVFNNRQGGVLSMEIRPAC